jgi:hypothetical protein
MNEMLSEAPGARDVIVEELGEIKPRSKIAYCFSSDQLLLLVSNSGHGKILRGRDKHDFDFGGWCDLKTGRLWPTNGTVSRVPPRWRHVIEGALELHFGRGFEWRG